MPIIRPVFLSLTALFSLLFVPCSFQAQPLKPFPIAQRNDPSQKAIHALAWFGQRGPDLQPVFSKGSKVEMGIDLGADIDNCIEAFFANSSKSQRKLNPYNRHDLAVEAEFYSNGILIQRRSGFFYQEFKRDLRNNKWIEDTTSYSFRIRFEPPTAGIYFARIVLTSKLGFTQTEFVNFEVLESADKGGLKVGSDGKHLIYSGTRESFHGVGQDIPWTSWEDWYVMDTPVGPKKMDMIHKALQAFDGANGNFTRFVAAPWFMQLEWEALGNYQPKMGQAWEFDRILDYCDEKEIYFLFCALMHGPLMSKADDKDDLPGIRWETNCYNDQDKTPSKYPCEPPVGINKAIEFYSNPNARDHVKNYFRYLSARYGYSSSLAGWQLMSEVDETAEYRDQEVNGQTIDHSENRKQVREWTDEMSGYIRNDLDDNQLISISIITGKNFSKTMWDPELYNLPNIDFFGYHDYMFESTPSVGKIRNRNLLFRYYSVTEMNTGFQNGSISYSNYQKKPFIYDEFGHILTIPQKWPEDNKLDPTKDFNNCADFMLKQDLWFTFVSGCAVAGLDWWNQDEQKRYEMWRKFYPPLLKFMQGIDFEKMNYAAVREVKGRPVIAQRWPLTDKEVRNSISSAYGNDDLLEAYMQVSDDGSQGFGWMANRSVHWYNLTSEYPCLKSLLEGTAPYHQSYLSRSQEDDLQDVPLDITENTRYIKMLGLKKRASYVVTIYSTTTSSVLKQTEVRTNGKGVAKIYAPAMDHKLDPDVAFKILEKGKNWR